MSDPGREAPDALNAASAEVSGKVDRQAFIGSNVAHAG
jgi:hypothetical protein